MVNLVQTAEVKTTVIAGLQRLGLGDAPVYKGSDWTDSELDLDFEELVADLAKMCQPYYGYAAPVYEL